MSYCSRHTFLSLYRSLPSQHIHHTDCNNHPGSFSLNIDRKLSNCMLRVQNSKQNLSVSSVYLPIVLSQQKYAKKKELCLFCNSSYIVCEFVKHVLVLICSLGPISPESPLTQTKRQWHIPWQIQLWSRLKEAAGRAEDDSKHNSRVDLRLQLSFPFYRSWLSLGFFCSSTLFLAHSFPRTLIFSSYNSLSSPVYFQLCFFFKSAF